MESLSLSHSVVNNLNATLYENTQIQRHLQTGRKIINNYEDSGGLGSITRLNSTVLRNQAIQQNLQGSLSLLQAQDGMLKVIGGVLDRSAELKTKFNSTMYNAHEYITIYHLIPMKRHTTTRNSRSCKTSCGRSLSPNGMASVSSPLKTPKLYSVKLSTVRL